MQFIDRTNLTRIRSSIQQALEAVADEYDVKISVGNASFTGNNASIKVDVATIAENGEVNTKEATDFKVCARRYGMAASDLGRTFHYDGHLFTLSGCKPRAKKYPILAKRLDGKTFKFGAPLVKSLLV